MNDIRPYVVTVKVDACTMVSHQKAFGVQEAVMQAAVAIGADYPGAKQQLLSVVPDEAEYARMQRASSSGFIDRLMDELKKAPRERNSNEKEG